MKKKFLFVISLILALVMSFCLIACGDGETNPNPGTKPPVNPPKPDTDKKEQTVDAALASAAEYFTAQSKSGEIVYSFHSDDIKEVGGSASFDIRGNEIEVSAGETSNRVTYLVNTVTGVVYEKEKTGYEFELALPQGAIEYLMAVAEKTAADAGVTPDDDASVTVEYDDFEFDEDLKTLVAMYDASADINRALKPAQEVYDGEDAEGSIGALVDAYVAEYWVELKAEVPMFAVLKQAPTLSSTLGMIAPLVATQKDAKIADMLDPETQAQYYAMLESTGLTGSSLTTAKNRTVGKAAKGLLTFVSSYIDMKKIAAGDMSGIQTLIGQIKNNQDALVAELLTDVLVADVDDSKIEKELGDLIKAVSDYIYSISFSGLIDDAAAAKVPMAVIKTVIAEPVTFEKIEFTTVFHLSDDLKKVETVELSFECAHNYKKETKLPFLSDNNYTAVSTITLGTASQTVTPFEMTFAPYDAETNSRIHKNAVIVASAAEKNDVSIYMETRMFDSVKVANIGLAYFDVSGKPHVYSPKADGEISYDQKTSSIVIKRSVINALAADKTVDLSQGLSVGCTVNYGKSDESYNFGAMILVAADNSAESLGNLVASVADKFGAGSSKQDASSTSETKALAA